MANTREFVLYSDSVMANANGDPINDNRPRQDERTGQLEMSDTRIKRYIRDEYINRGEKVFVQSILNDKGKFMDCKAVASMVIKDENIKKEQLEQTLKQKYKDVKLFGAVVTLEPNFNIIGPLQVMWSKTVHEADVKFVQGTSAFSSGEGKGQGTFSSKFLSPYALFRTYMVFNNQVALRQEIEVTEEEIEEFKEVLLSGIKNYKSTSKNQMPRLLLEIVYKENHIDGELDYIQIQKDKSDLELRSIDDFTFDLSPLQGFYEDKKDLIEKITIYVHPKVKLLHLFDAINKKLI